jgi:hypothetical protein
MSRTVLPGPKLYGVLSHEFEQSRPKACVSCRMPLPCLTDGFDGASANWRIGEVQRCVHGCHIVIAQVAAAVAARYDIALPYIVSGGGS